MSMQDIFFYYIIDIMKSSNHSKDIEVTTDNQDKRTSGPN